MVLPPPPPAKWGLGRDSKNSPTSFGSLCGCFRCWSTRSTVSLVVPKHPQTPALWAPAPSSVLCGVRGNPLLVAAKKQCSSQLLVSALGLWRGIHSFLQHQSYQHLRAQLPKNGFAPWMRKVTHLPLHLEQHHSSWPSFPEHHHPLSGWPGSQSPKILATMTLFAIFASLRAARQR